MDNNYTVMINSSIQLRLQEYDSAIIEEQLKSLDASLCTADYSDALKCILKDFSLSSRYALMRILAKRSMISMNSVKLGIEQAHSLSARESQHFIQLLCSLAEKRPDYDAETVDELISRAWFDKDNAVDYYTALHQEQSAQSKTRNKKESKAHISKLRRLFRHRLTRDEAFKLGHALGFSLAEMQWYLLRAFDFDEALMLRASNDLIEMYGFLTDASWQHVASLKAGFSSMRSELSDASPTPKYIDTKNMADNLAAQIRIWQQNPANMDAQFMNWLKQHADMLDHPSESALRIYRNLALYAFQLAQSLVDIPQEEVFLSDIFDISRSYEESSLVKQQLYEKNIVSERRCKEISMVLMRQNMIQSSSLSADLSKSWHTLKVLDSGELSPSGGISNEDRSRISNLLSGKSSVKKADLLYMFWFISNLVWQNAPPPDRESLHYRLLDFIDNANDLLNAALLPPMYLPHPLEQSMILSIIDAGISGEDPAVIYESMLHGTGDSRKHYSQKEKFSAVDFYRKHTELTLNECAHELGISSKCISAWQKKFIEDGLIPQTMNRCTPLV